MSGIQLKKKFGSHPRLAGVEKFDLEEPLAPNGKTFQTILLINVLEHIQDPQVALRGLLSKLAPNGKLLVLVPAYRWLYCQLDRQLGHHRRFNRKSLTQELDEAGYRIENLRSFNAMGIVGWGVWGKLLHGGLLQQGLIQTYETLMPLNKRVDKLFRNRIGLSLIAIASAK